jgi:hypothetical protein
VLYFHRTSLANARAILREGFRDGRGRYLTEHEFEGVWISEKPLDAGEGAVGDTLLAVSIKRTLVEDYEWKEEGKPYREFLVPAALLNSQSLVKILEWKPVARPVRPGSGDPILDENP